MEKFGQMKLKTYSKKEFIEDMQKRNINDDTVESVDEYFICIDSSGGPESTPYFKKQHTNVIHEAFDDVKEDMKKWGPDIQAYFYGIAITEQQASNLAQFIRKIPADSTINIHCIKGRYRSHAIRDFIKEVILDEETIWKGDTECGYYRIRRLLKEQWIS